jgi:uncharacterized membrane protein
MLSAISMHCFLRWKRQPSRWWALFYVISTALLLHTHYIFLPILMFQTLYLTIGRGWLVGHKLDGPRWKSWLAMQASIAVLLLPYIRNRMHPSSTTQPKLQAFPTRKICRFPDLKLLSLGAAHGRTEHR